MSRNLSPLQEAILQRVSDLERMPEALLCEYLGTYFRGLNESDAPWREEFSVAIELLVLYGQIRVDEHPRKGRILVDIQRQPRGLACVSGTDSQHTNAVEKRSFWPFSFATASVLLAAGCSLIPVGHQARAPIPLPVYGDGTEAPSRIEQFFNGRGMVYRYCADDECPSPTPKVAAASTQRIDTPRYEAVASTRQPSPLGAVAGAVGGGAERLATYTQTSPTSKKVATPFSDLVVASARAPKVASNVGAPAPTMLATMTQKETPAAGLALRSDAEFTSYKGLVSFQQGSMVLDGLDRQKVAELATLAREAERVRLRGHVATVQMNEELKKLAVGRAFAVKVEFVKHNVSKEKIKILNPQTETQESLSGGLRGVDVMLDMPQKKTMSGTLREGA